MRAVIVLLVSIVLTGCHTHDAPVGWHFGTNLGPACCNPPAGD